MLSRLAPQLPEPERCAPVKRAGCDGNGEDFAQRSGVNLPGRDVPEIREPIQLSATVESDGDPGGVPESEVDGERVPWRSAVPESPATDEEIEQFKAAVLAKLTLAVGKDAIEPRPAGTGLSPPRWPCATGSSTAGWRPTARASRKAASAIYYLSLEFLIGRLLERCRRQSAPDRCRARARSAISASISTGCAPPSPTPRWAMAGSAGSPRALWRAWRASACRPTATASAMTTGCSARSSRTAGSRNTPRNGCPSATRGNSSGRRSPTTFYYGGRVETRRVARRRVAAGLASGGDRSEAVAYDTPIVGWRGAYVNALRLWSARAADPMRLDVFNLGDHVGALTEQARAEAISKVLYPSDATPAGRELRLRQEYFFVSASLQDLVQRHCRSYSAIYTLPDHAAIQLNDTHPSIAIAELMRILVDLHNVPVGRRPGRSPSRPAPTPTTPCCRRRSKAGRSRCSSACCRAICRSSTGSTSAISRRQGACMSISRRGCAAVSLIDEERRPARQNGPPRLCRLAPHQRRVGAAYRADAQDSVRRP